MIPRDLQVPSSVTVKEGMCVTVPCKIHLFPYFLALTASWFREGADTDRDNPVATNDRDREVQAETQGRFYLLSFPRRWDCSLSITDARKADSGRYFLEVVTGKSQKRSYLDFKVYVNVTALTQKPDIYVPQTLEAGHPVTLNCTFPGVCMEGTPPIFSWRGAALSSQDPAHETTSLSEISLTPMPRDHGSSLTCRATFPKVNVSTERTIQLNLSYTPKNLTIHVVWGNKTVVIPGTGSYLLLPERETLLLVCIVDSNLSAMSSWIWEGRIVSSSPASDFQALPLKLPSLRVRDSGEYSCQVQHPFGTQHASLNLYVRAPMQENSSWPLILTLLRGVLMGIGFLLTYGLTWLYYTWLLKAGKESVRESSCCCFWSCCCCSCCSSRDSSHPQIHLHFVHANEHSQVSAAGARWSFLTSLGQHCLDQQLTSTSSLFVILEAEYPQLPHCGYLGGVHPLESGSVTAESNAAFSENSPPWLPELLGFLEMLRLEEVSGQSLDPLCSLAPLRTLVWLLLLLIIWGGLPQGEAELNPNIPVAVVTVQQNLCVQVPCTFYPGKDKANNQIFFFWYLREKSDSNLVATNKPHWNISERFRERFSVIRIPQNRNCTLSIKNAQKWDTGNYTLSIEKGELKHEHEKTVFVYVSDLTEKPDIQVPETLKAGVQGTLICRMPGSCDGENSPTFLWTGSALSSQSTGNGIHASSKISFIPKPRDHGTKITCRVTFKGSCVTSEKTIQLKVTYPPKKPTIQVHQGNGVLRPLGNAFHLPVLEGESLNLSCAADSNPAVPLIWTKGSHILISSQLSDAGAVSFHLHQVGLSDSGEYTCQTQEPGKSKKTSLMLSVQYPPKLLSSSCSWVEDGLLCTCSVQAQPAPSLCWWLGDNLVQDNSSNDTLQVVSTTSEVWTNSSLSWRQKPDPALSLRCEGKNQHGTHSLRVLLVPERSTPCAETNKKMLIMGAVCGAAVTGLLALGLLLIVVRTLKGKSAEVRTKTSEAKANVDNRHLPSEAIPLTPQGMLKMKSSLRPPSQDTVSPTSVKEPELHYACLSFQKLRPQNPQESAHTVTEYAEIKFQKSPL
ncbi:sialic acid-binding Ig-like lectin 5 [Trichosurus vulpecula]|uniref:sialic acid-binding Ig-like lectin 5 n=1 Tax=Trichosurus vulpecula TaxID=9337 RepID=UPI00186B206C|nr:sialic acid-binding Ig-like lectin 5 [Trichosurus vulpecula]